MIEMTCDKHTNWHLLGAIERLKDLIAQDYSTTPDLKFLLHDLESQRDQPPFLEEFTLEIHDPGIEPGEPRTFDYPGHLPEATYSSLIIQETGEELPEFLFDQYEDEIKAAIFDHFSEDYRD